MTISTPHFCELIKNHKRFVAEESITMLVTISSKIQNSVALLLFSIFDLTVKTKVPHGNDNARFAVTAVFATCDVFANEYC